MIKKGLILGLLGFILSLTSINLSHPEKIGSFQKAKVRLEYKDVIESWISFGKVLERNIREAFLSEDYLFVSMFMEKAMDRIPNKPEIIIVDKNNKVFWTNSKEVRGTQYKGWNEGVKEDFLIVDTLSKVKINIFSDESEKEVIGNLYLIIKNKPTPQRFYSAGWENYGSLLSASNITRGYVVEKNEIGIKNFVERVTKKGNIAHLTILSENGTLVWDINNLKNGKWIKEERYKNDENYYSFPIEYEGRKVATLHLLVNIPERGEKVTPLSNLYYKIKSVFQPKYLTFSGVSFFILFLFGSLLSRSAEVVSSAQKSTVFKMSPDLQNKIQALKEEIEELEVKKVELTEEVAKKQKVQKDLEKEIELLEEKKKNISIPTEVEEASLEEVSEEEELLFDRLLGETKKKEAQKQEELELTQRIVAKRREEIDLSSRIEAKRKELLELQRKIDNLKKK
ncbi:MAG: hypothetical protein ABIN61_07335 [candidate division WOR-3 bacterium]